jgi:hypothetical protein
MPSRSRWLSSVRMPRGLPRPCFDGYPVPFIAHVPLLSGRPNFREVNAERRAECQTEWLCQVCGLPLESSAYVVVRGSSGAELEILDGAALHRGCVELARNSCPFLRRVADTLPVISVRQDDVLCDGKRMFLTASSIPGPTT